MSASEGLPGVLGLLHADSTPLTHESCLHWAERLAAQNAQTAQARESLLCNFEGDSQEAEQLEGLARELRQGYAARNAWLALADVFRAVEP